MTRWCSEPAGRGRSCLKECAIIIDGACAWKQEALTTEELATLRRDASLGMLARDKSGCDPIVLRLLDEHRDLAASLAEHEAALAETQKVLSGARGEFQRLNLEVYTATDRLGLKGLTTAGGIAAMARLAAERDAFGERAEQAEAALTKTTEALTEETHRLRVVARAHSEQFEATRTAEAALRETRLMLDEHEVRSVLADDVTSEYVAEACAEAMEFHTQRECMCRWDWNDSKRACEDVLQAAVKAARQLAADRADDERRERERAATRQLRRGPGRRGDMRLWEVLVKHEATIYVVADDHKQAERLALDAWEEDVRAECDPEAYAIGAKKVPTAPAGTPDVYTPDGFPVSAAEAMDLLKAGEESGR